MATASLGLRNNQGCCVGKDPSRAFFSDSGGVQGSSFRASPSRPPKPITEARSEGSIELKLVRKPPKVSRGYGGVAPAALAQGSPSWRGALERNHYFGGSIVSPDRVRPRGGQIPKGVHFPGRPSGPK